MSDWIDRLRERGAHSLEHDTLGKPLYEINVLDPLWPLLCDVVEAAEGVVPLKESLEPSQVRVDRALAALKAEVEK